MNNRVKGSLFVLLSTLFFSSMSACIRLSGDIPMYEKAFFSMSVVTILSAAAVIKSHCPIRISKDSCLFVVLRMIFGVLGLICNYYAIDKINLSDANMLNKVSPFFSILFSAILLREKPKLYQILIVFGGFAGCLLIMKPTGAYGIAFPSIVAFLGGVSSGAAFVSVRGASNHGVPRPLLVFCYAIFCTIIVSLFLPGTYVRPNKIQLFYMVLAGILAVGGQLTITTAYAAAPAKAISILEYVQVVFSAVFGFFLFGQMPDILSAVGYIIIIGFAVINYFLGLRYDEQPKTSPQKD